MPKSARTIETNAAAGAVTELNMQHGLDWAGEDLAGWIITEKFDGCRAYWDGAELWSRSGIRIQIPAEWRMALPQGIHLDGEVYFGTTGLRSCATAVRYGKFQPGMRFMVFDAPKAAGDYLSRLAFARSKLVGNAVAIVAATTICNSTKQAIDLMRLIQASGGEGLMLRHPEIRYYAGRTGHLLKLKCVE